MTDTPKPGAEPLSDEELASIEAFVNTPWLSYPESAMPVARRLLATIAALKEEVAALTKICTVPGTWHCAKCGFVVQKMILDAHTGAVGVKPDTVTEPCPNGCGPLWPQTERARANALYDDANRFLDERDALQKEVAGAYQRGRDEQREKDVALSFHAGEAGFRANIAEYQNGVHDGIRAYRKAILESKP